ncbi:MAG TPA: hypothetical protein VM282_02450 [Acidimicrobiales bacterium]|nr:hypothetical protein [Acidimicrobiales bacterium]
MSSITLPSLTVEVFAGMMALTQSVISPADFAQVATRLGVG